MWRERVNECMHLVHIDFGEGEWSKTGGMGHVTDIRQMDRPLAPQYVSVMHRDCCF